MLCGFARQYRILAAGVSHGDKMKWNEWGFRPHLCTYRLHWAKRTSWWWWDEWDDTAFQPHESKFKPWRSDRWPLPLGQGGSTQYWIFTSEGGGIICFFEAWRPERETNPRSPTFQAALTTVPCRSPLEDWSALRGRGSGVVVKTACLECRDCGFEPHSGL